MADLVHDDFFDWPNGKGCRECTREYRETLDARNDIFDPNLDEGSTDDLSPEDYNRWHTLDHKLDQLHGAGHLGEIHEFAA